jgi:hypothetical protein
LGNDRGRGRVSVRPTDPAREAVIRVASTSYFDVMRIALVTGRVFERRDDVSAPARVVISESLATRLFPRESPLGRQIFLAERAEPAEVIGVVGDVKHRSLDEQTLPTVYLSAWQFPSRGSILVLRAPLAETDAMAIAREHVARLDGDLPVYGRASLTGMVARSPGVPVRRVLTAAYLGFALLAVVLGGIGLFGLVTHDVASRRAELALRMALGADPARLLTGTLGQGTVIVAAGLVVGAVLSYWSSRALRGFVMTSGFDPVSGGAAAAVLMLVGLCASLPGARRAARTDPLVALRGE